MSDGVIVMADGGSRGNPGRAGCGAIVLDGATRAILAYDNKALGICTNNVAEYSGLILGLSLAVNLEPTMVAVEMDSKLVVEQMAGRWAIKHPDMQQLAAAAGRLAAEYAHVTYGWIPRERNRRADHLANLAMDGQPPVPPHEESVVEVRRIKPTMPASGSRPRFETFSGPTTVKIERTSALAKVLLLEGPATTVARSLIEEAPEDMVGIWGGMPSVKWLAAAVESSPLSWRRGQRDEESA